MRKKTVNHLADTIFWYVLYFMPVICYLLYLFAEPATGTVSAISFTSFIENIGFGFVSDNIIITSLKDIFYTGGIFPIFSTDMPFIIFSWFIGVYIAHLAVDFLLFIPRLCHKWLKQFTQGE